MVRHRIKLENFFVNPSEGFEESSSPRVYFNGLANITWPRDAILMQSNVYLYLIHFFNLSNPFNYFLVA